MTRPALKSTFLATSMALAVGFPAIAQEFTIRAQTHNSQNSTTGQGIAQFVDDVDVMSGGRLKIEMYYSNSVVKQTEALEAAATGIIDVDMTGAANATGRDRAFQFVGDVMGGYDTPWQYYAWLYSGGGMEAAQPLYEKYGLHLVGFHLAGQESLVSTRSIGNVAELKDWKFRSPPGLETEMFSKLGASPIVMDYSEVATGLETKIIDGADVSSLANNLSLGAYDIAKYTTYPGFHAMPSEHFAIRKDLWDSLPEDLQRILEVAVMKLAFAVTMEGAVQNEIAVKELTEQGVTLQDWSAEDRAAFRDAAKQAWAEFAGDNDLAKSLIQSHLDFLTTINAN